MNGNQIEETLRAALAWLETWGQHVGTCQEGSQCTCGLTRIQYELQEAIRSLEETE